MIPSLGQRILAPFSSVRTGIVLLAILFLYMSVGSAGILYPIHPNVFHPDAWVHAQMRQWRPFEMTEFEWFHWWPFNLLMGLIAANITVTTLRRIPWRPVNYGVWMIHSGILLLILGSVVYFGTKVEGETAVVRRAVTVSVLADDGSGRVLATDTMIASPGNRLVVGTGADRYEVEVQGIDPDWELKSPEDLGTRAYSVNMSVTAPQRRFIRQLIDGRDQYTEDLIITQDQQQPVKRAVKETGKRLVDERLRMTLGYDPRPDFYLKNDLNKSWALYLRRPGARAWVQRPVHGLPLYNDYLSSLDDIFVPAGQTIETDPIRVAIPAVSPDDPVPDLTFDATGFLRYAEMRARWVPGGPDAAANAVAFVEVGGPRGERGSYRLVARDPQKRSADGGVIALRQIVDEEQLKGFMEPPTLVFRVKGKGIDVREPVKDAAMQPAEQPLRPIGGADSGYSYRIVGVQDDLPIGGRELSVAILEIHSPKGEFRRWVFSDATMSRDLKPGEDPMAAMKRGGESWIDDTIEVEYRPGNGLALVLLVAGPEAGRLRLIDALDPARATVSEVEPRRPAALNGGLALTVTEWLPRAEQLVKPAPVPQEQRVRDARELFSMMRLSVAGGAGAAAAAPKEAPNAAPDAALGAAPDAALGAPVALGSSSVWLPYHPWVFDRQQEVLRRYWLKPTTVRLPDGSDLEVLFSRQRMPLPAPIALESFVLATNIGGFSGETSSIRNYTSVVRFQEPGGTWTPAQELSVNEPVEYGGYSYFQSQWDPPDEARQGGMASAGLNYTVLGVGNRHGVLLQLAGCIVAVLGMMYAFYVKPVIKRRNRRRVLEEIARAKAEGRAPRFPKDLTEAVHA